MTHKKYQSLLRKENCWRKQKEEMGSTLVIFLERQRQGDKWAGKYPIRPSVSLTSEKEEALLYITTDCLGNLCLMPLILISQKLEK